MNNSRSSEMMKRFTADSGLGDGWRLKRPKTRDSLSSPVHRSCCCIYGFLISNSVISKIIDMIIPPIIIRDYSPVPLTWNINKSVFERLILKEKRKWPSFLEIKESPEYLHHFSGIQGQIISSSTQKKKEVWKRRLKN